MPRLIRFAGYEIAVFSKEDGDARDPGHLVHYHYLSVTQVHQPLLYYTHKDDIPGPQTVQADALIDVGYIPIGVYVADCLPLVVCHAEYVAVVHVSRKTAYLGIVQSVLSSFVSFGVDVSSLHCWLGPHIQHYEVGSEFVQYFPSPYLQSINTHKFTLDLAGYVSSLLMFHHIPLSQIVRDSACTLSDLTYRSRRRGERGRNFVGVKKL